MQNIMELGTDDAEKNAFVIQFIHLTLAITKHFQCQSREDQVVISHSYDLKFNGTNIANMPDNLYSTHTLSSCPLRA